MNHLKGDIKLQLGDQLVKVCFDWEAIGCLVNRIGKDFDSQLTRASVEYDLDIYAKALQIGLEKHHPGQYTIERIFELSPPIAPAMEAVQQALTVAFHGTLEVPGQPGENPLMRAIRYVIEKLRTGASSRTPSTAAASTG